ncbi:MAG TPA: LapA family protein [Noviherbaspirillum sp.]|jgi:uncharacterized membrane protein|uniref:LapA family protein n=1 Tax=Noviherbaspirillum sp. TaxID=1926288 RepID=UPI002F955709
MKIRTLLLLLALAAIVAFTALNWETFLAPSMLSVGFADFQAPLGMVMLGLLTLLALVFLSFIVYLQTSVLLDARRHARELQSQRALADQAEASRFTELRAYLEGEMQAIAARDTENTRALVSRIDQLEATMRAALDDANNTLAAYLGELEDRLDRNDNRQPGTPRRLDH